MLSKVSVVVPVYKVEKYIHRCVNSILQQTYKNIEVILVDDGSPDKCGEIADSFAQKDRRVRTIHKPNGGLSDARNCGMKYVSGEYILFVDSDDWMSEQMIEVMVTKSLEYNADIVQSAFLYAYEDYLLFDDRYYPQNAPVVILDNSSLMSELVTNERVPNFAWGKLYKTHIICDISFEKGVLFEDVFWAHKVMQRVNTYVILNQPMYYYYQRSDSIVAVYTLKNLDIIRGLKERHCFIEQHYSCLTDKSYKLILKTSLMHYYLLSANRNLDKNGIYRKEIQSYITNNFNKLKKAVSDDKQLKCQLYYFKVSPILNRLFLVVNKVLRKLRIVPQPACLKRVSYKRVTDTNLENWEKV